jgi:K+/H+ antiporter YhaU regulatory subunit KhtT
LDSTGNAIVSTSTEEDQRSPTIATIHDGAASQHCAIFPDDTTTEFATLVIRDLAPKIEIVARVNESPSIPKAFRAGGDYVLSLATVTGRMIASRVLEGRDVLSLDQQVEVVRMGAPRVVGRTIGEADIRARTGATVRAIERDGELVYCTLVPGPASP